jgi:hypothetical protein
LQPGDRFVQIHRLPKPDQAHDLFLGVYNAETGERPAPPIQLTSPQ